MQSIANLVKGRKSPLKIPHLISEVSPMTKKQKSKRAGYMADYRRSKVRYINCAIPIRDYKRLLDRAEKIGVKPTVYLREAAFAYMNQRYLVPQNIEEELRRFILLMRNIGNSLNQIAAKANTLKRVTVFDLHKAKKRINQLEESVEAFIRNPPKIEEYGH